jgi:hypothetical protein
MNDATIGRRAETDMRFEAFRLSEGDLDFLVATGTPDVRDRARVKRLIETDDDFCQAFISDERTFRRVMADDEVFLKISPRLYFEILLRKARRDLEGATHTIERVGVQKVAVFDTKEVVDLLEREEVILYLADMLSSFTKVESYTVSYRVREGLWRKIRFNDLDMDSLIGFCRSVEEEHRLGFFKRIADICLFILGLFPEHVEYTWRYPSSGEQRPGIMGSARRTVEDYEEEGRKFYRLAAESPGARQFALREVFNLLHGRFHVARKPLGFIAKHYLHSKTHHLFGLGTG